VFANTNAHGIITTLCILKAMYERARRLLMQNPEWLASVNERERARWGIVSDVPCTPYYQPNTWVCWACGCAAVSKSGMPDGWTLVPTPHPGFSHHACESCSREETPNA
jgi:hypothetical protein